MTWLLLLLLLTTGPFCSPPPRKTIAVCSLPCPRFDIDFISAGAAANSAPADYEYYEYYYEDELPPTAASGTRQQADKATPDYDISELVKAWKEYIREKAAKSTTTQAPLYDYYYDEQPPPPRRRRPRPRQRPRPAPVRIEEYECEPRTESYRTPDPLQCDK